MALPWVRLDTQWASNPKFLGLIEDKKHRAVVAYMASLGYSGAHGTDGFIPKGALAFLHGTAADAKALTEVGLWNTCGGGWEINDWNEYQQSSEEAQKRKEKAKLAAMKRWHG